MRSVLRSTAILGSSSVITILVGLIASKAWAMLLGPSGLGLMGLLGGLFGLSSLIAGMGIGTALVRTGAHALGEDKLNNVAALQRGAWLITLVSGGTILLLFTVFRVQVSRWMLGNPAFGGSVTLVGVALLFHLASGVQVSMLNAYHRVSALAKVSVITSIFGTTCSIVLVWLWHEQAIALGYLFAGIISFAISRRFLHREIVLLGKPSINDILRAAQSLLRFGIPYTLSMMVGTGIQMILPVIVLYSLGTESVGYHRAATTIGTAYLAFMLNAMGQDYLPRLASVGPNQISLVNLINQQHRLVMLLSVPMILGILAVIPVLLPVIYSHAFSPAVEILEWQLLGDLFKFSSWTMSYAILARSGSLTFFCVELVGGIVNLTATWFGMRWFGLAGLGIGFVVSYSTYFAIVWFVVRREIEFRWSLENKVVLTCAILSALTVRMLPLAGLAFIRMPVALVLALLFAIWSVYALLSEVGWRSLVRLRGVVKTKQYR